MTKNATLCSGGEAVFSCGIRRPSIASNIITMHRRLENNELGFVFVQYWKEIIM